jgi:hypothetical protein
MVGGVQRWGGAHSDRGLGVSFGSWGSGTGSEHGLEKSSGARERRNWRLSSASTGARQRCETAMANERWRNRVEAVLASQKRYELCFFPWSRHR